MPLVRRHSCPSPPLVHRFHRRDASCDRRGAVQVFVLRREASRPTFDRGAREYDGLAGVPACRRERLRAPPQHLVAPEKRNRAVAAPKFSERDLGGVGRRDGLAAFELKPRAGRVDADDDPRGAVRLPGRLVKLTVRRSRLAGGSLSSGKLCVLGSEENAGSTAWLSHSASSASAGLPPGDDRQRVARSSWLPFRASDFCFACGVAVSLESSGREWDSGFRHYRGRATDSPPFAAPSWQGGEMRRKVILGGLVLVAASMVLGSTVFREEVAQAAMAVLLVASRTSMRTGTSRFTSRERSRFRSRERSLR